MNARIFGQLDHPTQAGAYLGVGDEGGVNPNGPGGYGKGTTARAALVIWGVSVVWLVLVWRAVEGY